MSRHACCGRGRLGRSPRQAPAPIYRQLYQHQDLGPGVRVLPLEPEQLLWVDNNSNRNPS